MEIYTGLIEFNWTLLFMWLTILVLYLVMKHFFFENVHNFMQERSNRIKRSFDEAEELNLKAEEALNTYNKKIEEIEAEGREIIKQAKLQADIQAKNIIREANERASEILKEAEIEIEKQKLQAINEMKSQIASLAILAAEKLLEQQLETYGQEELIDRIIKEAGSSAWRN
ncbi:MAG: F0F1 ATP synthase subunit B [Clostridiales bacterium]|nr:F0F1 ATP synthase subunit B [Clostridiales bacterium]